MAPLDMSCPSEEWRLNTDDILIPPPPQGASSKTEITRVWERRTP
jgi:hypothetical protein